MTPHLAEIARYGINGVLATLVHYGVLTANLQWFGFQSAGVANLVAACFGITASFIGSRYFVFPHGQGGLLAQFVKFSGLYAGIAVFHGIFLWLWADVNGLDYRIGFLIATGMQVAFSYVGNKLMVFKT